MDEYQEFVNKYKNYVAFNDNRFDNNKHKKILLAMETYCIMPENYAINNLKRYRALVTYNKKVKDLLGGLIEVHLINGFPCFNRHFKIDSFKKFEDKIDGITLLCRYRKNEGPGAISEKRLEVMQNLHTNGIRSDCFGRFRYDGELYKGAVGIMGTNQTHPSSIAKLQKINEYKFNLAFENCYHPLWSWNYLTEKLVDAFRAKVVPIYYGAYNIEELVPKELYIDYRGFKSDEQLAKYLKSFSKGKYEDMTGKAYEWDRKTRWGNIEDLGKILDKLI